MSEYMPSFKICVRESRLLLGSESDPKKRGIEGTKVVNVNLHIFTTFTNDKVKNSKS